MSGTVNFSVFIPARLESTRLPGKVLLDIAGQPMLQHVYERALNSGAERVVIATDNDKIAAVARSFGAEICMTSTAHHSGTERIGEAVAQLALPPSTIIVNLQADEPLAPPSAIRALAQALEGEGESGVEMATLCTPIKHREELLSADVVKVVGNRTGCALYFSRAPIPWSSELRDNERDTLPAGSAWMRHIGLYAYRHSLLNRWAKLPKSPLERSERLEQLRALWNDVPIRLVTAAQHFPAGIDTAADLARIREHFCERGHDAKN